MSQKIGMWVYLKASAFLFKVSTVPYLCLCYCISRVSDQNGISQLYHSVSVAAQDGIVALRKAHKGAALSLSCLETVPR